MPALDEIPGIGKGSLELLDAAGIRDAAHLTRQDPDKLVAEIHRANEVLGISKRSPGIATVDKWINAAIDLIGAEPTNAEAGTEPAPESNPPVNYEASGEVADMLQRAPFAIPLPGKAMMENKLGVSDVPAGLLLNRYSGDLDVRIGDPENPGPDVPARRAPAAIEQRATAQPERRQFDASNVKPATTESQKRGTRVPKSKEGHEHDRVALIRAPLEKTNRGKNPNSRRYIRGVLHTHPWSLRVGAVFSLLLLVNLPLAVISAFLLLISRENPGALPWVPEWILAFPIALPIIGIGYMIWGFNGKCRICTQKLFVHKAALKHVKAHRLPGLGFVIPLCLYLLLFNWFRCSSCGTPVRLKK